MAKSMTGYGSAQVNYQGADLSIEIRSVNSRFQEIIVKVPKNIQAYEATIKERIKSHSERGKISAYVQLNDKQGSLGQSQLNKNAVSHYMNILNEMKSLSGSTETIALSHLLQFDDIIVNEDTAEIDSELNTEISRMTDEAMHRLDEMRSNEGESLVRDLKERTKRLIEILKFIESESTGASRQEFEKLYKRLQENIDLQKIDRDRLELELAIISDRVDVTEECVRLNSHLSVLTDLLDSSEPIGKKLNFLSQEILREANTIGSKTANVTVSH
ncbi:MAG: YicC family protein, partial [Calditrichaeota bacterium]|nr:YicC family protein [Calditrichota bacterium]